ncbi:MAG: alanine transaminase [Desulfobacteria bacterium]|nr:alanine transaminase [Deltaproteobacteria bacterium]OYV99280.1 MAG: alanine transaminase [Deltaproteobacteria bacterium 37-65-8]HQT98275.1 alanine transaminase [Thermodesulfobacteriota bacterium]
MEEFARIQRLPPYVFAVVVELKSKLRHAGEDIIDLGMGNPDLPTPKHIVDKLVEAVRNPRNHRYSLSRGIPKLRLAICNWYKRKYNVDLDPETEAIATIGAKEGLSHLVLATMGPGDIALVPSPTYPIHTFSVVIAGADVRSISLTSGEGDFVDRAQRAIKMMWPRPKMMIISFPHNPTTQVVDLDFFRRVVAFAKEHNLLVIHDLAYADLVFDGYKAPSILQVPGAKDVAVEMYSMSKGYSMPGWRVGFVVGNKRLVGALTRMKSYLDYGMFQAIQVAAIAALNGPQRVVDEAVEIYRKRRDCLVDGFSRIGWEFGKPKGTMFVWAPIPEPFREMGSVEFSKLLLTKAKVAVSPGVGFGEHGEGFVRFALVENEHRIRQAIRGVKGMLQSPPKVKAK